MKFFNLSFLLIFIQIKKIILLIKKILILKFFLSFNRFIYFLCNFIFSIIILKITNNLRLLFFLKNSLISIIELNN